MASSIVNKKNNIEDIYPVTPIQSGLIFRHLYDPNSDAYFVQRVFELKNVNIGLFKQSWQVLLERHEALRASFSYKKLKNPVQIIHRKIITPWKEKEIQNLTYEEQRECLNKIIKKERQEGFDIQKAPLMRFNLLRIEKDKYYFVWNQHHLLIDGWCVPVILEELSDIYDSLITNSEPNLKQRRNYRDYIKWIQNQSQDAARDYWQKELLGIKGTKISIKSKGEDDYIEDILILSEQETNNFNELAKDTNVTLNTIFQAIWALILSQQTGQREVVFGVTVSGRNIDLEGVEDMIGIFINTIPLRLSIDTRETLQDFLRKIQIKMSFNQERVYISLAEIQATQREHQLFDTLFVFENYPRAKKKSTSFNSFSLKKHRNLERTEYALALTIIPSDETRVCFNYNKKHLQKHQITSLQQIFKRFCEFFVKERKNLLLGNMSTITQKELAMLQNWNKTKNEYPKNKTVCQLFEESTQANPDKIAIIYKDQQISYEVLNQRANQLSHYLVKQGVSLETPIVIFIPRSLELVIGLLAILKSGGTYVPIDPEYPAVRIHYMLEDSKAPIILTHSSVIDKLPSNCAVLIDIDEIKKELQLEKTIDPSIRVPSDSLCYIIYTSGSTGKPKGVGVTHSNLTHYLNYSKEVYFTHQKAVAILHSSVVFDMSITSLYSPLITGNTIYILPSNFQINSLEIIAKELSRVNFLKLTPTHLKALQKEDTLRNILNNKISCLVVGGENILKEDVIALFNSSSSINSIFNEYGPTETTVGCCAFKIKQLEHLTQISIPIGRPIHNTQIYILDPNLNQVPIGTIGEICVGGGGVARGYIGKPDLTSEKFIANPYASKEEIGNRLYRTGDLGRYLSDGNIEFIGRRDYQIKIRGFRIELEEIELALAQGDRIKQAVVLAREDIPGQRKLVGYVTLKGCSTKNFTEESKQELIKSLRGLIARSLPDYMQLSQIVILDEMPLTQNGKLDRNALPTPEGRDGIGVYKDPEGLLEQELAVTWQELLKVETVGRNDNFFNLGGHSLLATQLIAKMRHEQGIEIPLKTIFEHATLQNFARSLTDQYLSQDLLPPIKKVSKDQIIPLSFAQQSLYLLYRLATSKGMYHISRAIRLGGELDVLALKKSLNHMIKRHEILRTSIIGKEGVGRQIILNEDRSFDLTEVNVGVEEELYDYFAKESTSPFDLEQGLLHRGTLIKLNGEYIFLVTFHQIISDSWSVSIWIKEFYKLYLFYKEGIEANLPAIYTQYADFSIWQRSWLKGHALEKQFLYWEKQLTDTLTLELPTDYSRPKRQTYEGHNYSFQLDREAVNSIKTISKNNGTTLFMTMLSAFQGMLSKYTKQTDIVIGTPVAGRRMQETENLIGFFVNILVLRTNTSHNPTFKELLSQVKKITLEAYSYQDIPFEQLVEHLNVPKDLSKHPIFQVMFILQKTKHEELKFGDVKPEVIVVNNNQTKFDLSLNIVETKEGLNLRFDYASDLFKQETIENLSNYYRNFIHEVIQDQDKKLSEIALSF
jgi:amino acid adenylation domain-containing protein